MTQTALGQHETLEMLFDLSSSLKDISSSDEAFTIIAEKLKKIVGSDFTAVITLDPERGTLKVAGGAGMKREEWKLWSSIPPDESFRRRVASDPELKVHRFEGVDEMPDPPRGLAKRAGIDKFLVSPIIYRGELLGYLGVANRKGAKAFDERCEQIVAGLSVSLAMIIDNVNLSAKLRSSRNETEELLNIAPIGILRCDARGIFKAVNRHMLNMFERHSAEGLLGTSVFEMPFIARSGLDSLIMQAMDGREGEKADVHMVTRPDRALYLYAKATPVKSEEGEVREVMLVAMDVSSKVRLQSQLERSYEKLTQAYQELERVATMKTHFIDVVSHELRTPLTVMRGYIDLMESEYAAKLDPKFASRLRTIKSNTDRLYSLVESMLDVSRLEKGSLQMNPEPVRLDTMLEEVVNARRHEADDKKQTMVLEIDGSLPLLMADRRRLRDVFNNIVDNAIKYTQEGGRIQVCARDEGKIVHVWVKDNGIGIPLENISRLFDRFHIVTSNDLSHQVDRLGLGLPISKGIVEAHGGRIWVESQVGKGSVFHVGLPKETPK
ncbi:MAG: PAS domain-containing protein [Candidatus Thermoplasmatota archaeon]|nr:PAS domain-containing protein [Candidatus Thermoplasmatota archaeon]